MGPSPLLDFSNASRSGAGSPQKNSIEAPPFKTLELSPDRPSRLRDAFFCARYVGRLTCTLPPTNDTPR